MFAWLLQVEDGADVVSGGEGGGVGGLKEVSKRGRVG